MENYNNKFTRHEIREFGLKPDSNSYYCQDCSSIEFNPKCNQCLADKAAESSDYETWWGLPEEV